MDGWKDRLGWGSEGFLQQTGAMSFRSGVISFTHHLFIETALVLALPSTICDGNCHHLTSFSSENTNRAVAFCLGDFNSKNSPYH